MPRAPKTPDQQDGFINLPVNRSTREGLHRLKDLLDARSQSEVIARLVTMGLAVHDVMNKPRSKL